MKDSRILVVYRKWTGNLLVLDGTASLKDRRIFSWLRKSSEVRTKPDEFTHGATVSGAAGADATSGVAESINERCVASDAGAHAAATDPDGESSGSGGGALAHVPKD